MEIRGMTLADAERCVRTVSHVLYEGNIGTVEGRDLEGLGRQADGTKAPKCRFNLRPTGGGEAGRHIGRFGRRLYACTWEAWRDVMAEIFSKNPQAVLVTARATYRGLDDFLDSYEATQYFEGESPLAHI